jgi:hypothetical protein
MKLEAFVFVTHFFYGSHVVYVSQPVAVLYGRDRLIGL